MKRSLRYCSIIVVLLSAMSICEAGIDGVVPYRKGNLWGLCDHEKKMILEPKYSYIADFHFGLACYESNNLWGYLNEKGVVIVEAKYENIKDFEGRVGRVALDKMENGMRSTYWGLIDAEGKVILEANKYNYITEFTEGKAHMQQPDPVTYLYKYGVIDEAGKEIVPCKYDNVGHFSQGRAYVHLDDKWGWIDETGNEIVGRPHRSAQAFHNGFARIQSSDSFKWGYADLQGQTIGEVKYELTYSFAEGLGIVESKEGYGFVDEKGEEVIACQYESGYSFTEGLSCVKKDGVFGFIDKQGETVIPFQFEDARPFSEGRALVRKDGKYGYIDSKGSVVVPCEYELFDYSKGEIDGTFTNGYAVVVKDGICGFINKQGKIVIPFEYKWVSSYAQDGFVKMQEGYVSVTGVKYFED